MEMGEGRDERSRRGAIHFEELGFAVGGVGVADVVEGEAAGFDGGGAAGRAGEAVRVED